MRNYPDESWPMAASYGTNNPSILPWGYFEGIEPKAAWIWTNDNTGDVEVYCRRNIVFPCTKGELNVHKSLMTMGKQKMSLANK